MKALRTTALILTIIGGLNWGLVGLFGFDLVAYIFGTMSILSRIVYILVGVSAVILAFQPTCSIKETIQHKMN
ncbi:MAG: DUF378 domain-containing protein [Alphaproteobacteria bacterium]|nr:DUF378 domain-containing protein [Alphaproteobacteria bacterium]